MFPNKFMSLMNNVMKVRERKKNYLMKVYIDCNRSTLDKIVFRKKFKKLAKSDSDTSTSYSNDDISSDKENMKPPAVVSKNKHSLVPVNKCTNDAVQVSPTPTPTPTPTPA